MQVQKRTIQKWCTALRSGEYKQGIETLQSTKGFCCLGVACSVVILPKNTTRKHSGYLHGAFPDDQLYAPKWLQNINYDFGDLTGKSLSDLNDSGKYNFNEIADLLEAVYIHKVLS